jgi:hypothetical protein
LGVPSCIQSSDKQTTTEQLKAYNEGRQDICRIRTQGYIEDNFQNNGGRDDKQSNDSSQRADQHRDQTNETAHQK